MAAVDKQTALVPADDSTKIVAIKSNEFKVPKPRRKKVLEEDEYEESITKIIERDFYPELPKLRAQSEYLEAKAKNDREKLRELHIKYGPKGSATGSRRQDPSATDLYTTPASFDTPGVKTPSSGTEKMAKGTAKESSRTAKRR
ncbi:DGCR14 [Bugula neritina]|uniref:DGCR14 n=1 Tax=Bugula neritina TaxID=10212 RepID=A0A7J7K8C1_BUGNE|nr:DGCR14 [Bugula neritina]